ncbi:MAG TPA: TonB-dependent receptor [Gemmatimonadales bacterium]
MTAKTSGTVPLTAAVVLCGAFLVSSFPLAAQQPTRVLRGRVLSVRDSTPMPAVWVEILATSLSGRTDTAGRFVFPAAPRETLHLVVRRLGVASDTVLVPADRDSITIYVHSIAIDVAPVVTVGRPDIARERFETEAQTSAITLERAEIAGTPGLFEADVVRVVQLLPGSVAKNDYTIGYNVRGGESDQNLILLDGVPIFNPSHLAGLFSTFDANAVSRTDFLTGGFPAHYPGRLSSVLDISLRTGNPDHTQGQGQVSLLSSKMLVEGPVGGATYLLGVRRTYADALAGVFPYYFTDVIGKTRAPLGRRGSLALTAYWGRDVLDLELVRAREGHEAVNLAFNWGNRLLGATWSQAVGAVGLIQNRASISEFSTTLGLLPDLARFDNSARLLSASTTFVPHPSAVHDVRLGAAVERYQMNYEISSASLETTFFQASYAPTVLSAFVDDQWHAANWLLLRPGVRLDYVTGARFTGVSPRASFKLFLDKATALTGSAGRYYQAIHSIRDQEIPITIYEFWIGANEHIPVAQSDHGVLGVERWFGRDVQVVVEGYRKTFDNLVTPNRAQDLRVEGDEYIPATGSAWGIDLLVRRHVGTIRGWLAYGFTRAARRAAGVTYPPAHDRRHTLNVVLQIPGPLGSDMGVRWGVGSPLPYTGFVGEWYHRLYNAGAGVFSDVREEPIAAKLNGERYPTYTRLDVGFRWAFEKWGVQWQPYLQVANAYNRRNVFVYFFNYADAPPTRTGVSQLPILPTIGLEFAW